MKRRWLIVLVAGLLVGKTADANDPFSVDAELLNTATDRILSVSFSIPERHHLYADRIDIKPSGTIRLLPRQIPPADRKKDPFGDTDVDVYEHDMTFLYEVQGDTSTGAVFHVKYQGCGERECFFPVTQTLTLFPTESGVTGLRTAGRANAAGSSERPTLQEASDGHVSLQDFVVAGRATGYLSPAKFLQFLDDVERGRGNPQDRLPILFNKKGIWIWLAVLLVLMGGLGLNLTPCVLPMIPINIAIIGAGAQAGSRLRGFALGSVYGLGMALAYGGVGLFVVLTGSKFGMLNSSPIFNAVIAGIFVVLALAMFDIVTIDFSRYQGTSGPRSARGGFATVFFMGVVSALLAGACVAPVVVSVLLLATDLYRNSRVMGLILPFLLGVGMAIPWPLAGAGLSFLPKPGRWMKLVKRGFGILILVMAGWYAYQTCLLVHCGMPPHRAETSKTLKENERNQGWMTSLDEALSKARKEGKILIVDFWASWCKNCLTMEETTFKDEDVNRRLEAYVRVKYQAEDLSDLTVKNVLAQFGVVGLPTYVVLKPVRSAERAHVNE
jgi:thiol:disulfide interchange protein